jgi:hypothetical protein
LALRAIGARAAAARKVRRVKGLTAPHNIR